jgi:hypothetical protein
MARSIDRGNQFSPPPRPLFLRPPLLARLEIELGSDRERMRQERLSFIMSRRSCLFFLHSIQLVSSCLSPPKPRYVPRESRRRRSRFVSVVLLSRPVDRFFFLPDLPVVFFLLLFGYSSSRSRSNVM